MPETGQSRSLGDQARRHVFSVNRMDRDTPYSYLEAYFVSDRYSQSYKEGILVSSFSQWGYVPTGRIGSQGKSVYLMIMQKTLQD
jgi:hypothetical protein